ncbi:hypothetical protein RhiirA1_484184, partial [Rhizophagus irregularis]
RKELADIIRAYKEDHDAKIIPTPSGYETIKIDQKDKGKAQEIPEEHPKTDMEHQWEAANKYVDWNEEDLDHIVRALPTRSDIKELQYSGARFSRGAIARLEQRLQSHLFSLLDHYDEAQLPDDADPDYFE